MKVPPPHAAQVPGWVLLARARLEAAGLDATRPLSAIMKAAPERVAASPVSAPDLPIELEIPAAQWAEIKQHFPELEKFVRSRREGLTPPIRVAAQTVLNELGGASPSSGRVWESWLDDDGVRHEGAPGPRPQPSHAAAAQAFAAVEPGRAEVFEPTQEDVVAAVDLGAPQGQGPRNTGSRTDIPPFAAAGLEPPRLRLDMFAAGVATLATTLLAVWLVF